MTTEVLGNRIKRFLLKIYCFWKRFIAKHITKTTQEIVRNNKKGNGKIAYIIRRDPGAGFFSDYFYVLSHIRYAQKKFGLNVDCVVDMQHYLSLYNERRELYGSKNGWEHYFLQPNNIKLDEVKKYSTIVFSKSEYKKGYDIPIYAGAGKEVVFPSRSIVAKLNDELLPLTPFSDNVLSYLNDKKLDLFRTKKVLGIHVRGTDMWEDSAHPNPFTVENVIKFILDNDLEKKNDYIFVCSDEAAYINEFKKAFSNVFFFDCYRSVGHSNSGIHKQRSKRKLHKYQLGLEVIRDMYCLSLCDTLICGKSNVDYASIVFNNNRFSHLICWDNLSYRFEELY